MSFSDEQLQRFGWQEFFAANFAPYAKQGYRAGRVALEYNQFQRVLTTDGEVLAVFTKHGDHASVDRKGSAASFCNVTHLCYRHKFQFGFLWIRKQFALRHHSFLPRFQVTIR